jgi:hypothetical protein
MTQPQAEAPPNVPPQDEVERILGLLVAGASVAVVLSALGGMVGVGAAGAKALGQFGQLKQLLDLPGPSANAGPVVMTQHLSNLRRRAAYVVNAARRFGTAAVREKSNPGSIQRALQAEGRYLQQHLSATKKRNEAATLTQAELNKRSLPKGANGLLGWNAVLDNRTSAECRRANGKNFYPLQPPAIGLPGAVHDHCRCRPGPPHPTNQMVGGPLPRKETVSLARKDEVSSASLPDLLNKPGKTNWVEKSGGLPSYIKRIAKHLQAKGMSEGAAIAAAVNTVRRWAAGGTVAHHGTTSRITPKTQAQAAAAYAEWKAKAASSHGGKKS